MAATRPFCSQTGTDESSGPQPFFAPRTSLCSTRFSWTSLQGVVDKYDKIKPVPEPKKKVYS